MGQLFLNLRAKKSITFRMTAVYFSSVSEAGVILKVRLGVEHHLSEADFFFYNAVLLLPGSIIHSTRVNGKLN